MQVVLDVFDYTRSCTPDNETWIGMKVRDTSGVEKVLYRILDWDNRRIHNARNRKYAEDKSLFAKRKRSEIARINAELGKGSINVDRK